MSAATRRTEEPKFLTVKKTTEVFSISKSTLYRLIRTGNIRPQKLGRRVLIEGVRR